MSRMTTLKATEPVTPIADTTARIEHALRWTNFGERLIIGNIYIGMIDYDYRNLSTHLSRTIKALTCP